MTVKELQESLKEDQCKILWRAFEATKRSKKTRRKFHLNADERGKLKIEYIDFQ